MIGICWYCGNDIEHEYEKPHNRLFHPECYQKFQIERDKQLNEYLKLKTEIMYERALRDMEKQDHICLADYYDEAQLVHDMAIADFNKFQSSDEMMTAMELVRMRVKAKVQFKLGRRRIDFLLPELKVALEIDGSLHKFKVVKDSQREIEILNKLNENDSGWDVIRIPTELIEQNLTKLVPAIKALYKKRQQLRKDNSGFIPLYWSRTNTMSQALAVNDKTLQDEAETPSSEL